MTNLKHFRKVNSFAQTMVNIKKGEADGELKLIKNEDNFVVFLHGRHHTVLLMIDGVWYTALHVTEYVPNKDNTFAFLDRDLNNNHIEYKSNKLNPKWTAYQNAVNEGGEGYNPHPKYI